MSSWFENEEDESGDEWRGQPAPLFIFFSPEVGGCPCPHCSQARERRPQLHQRLLTTEDLQRDTERNCWSAAACGIEAEDVLKLDLVEALLLQTNLTTLIQAENQAAPQVATPAIIAWINEVLDEVRLRVNDVRTL